MITVKVISKTDYAVRLIPGEEFKSDKERMSDMPDRRGVWITDPNDGIETFSHYVVPRCDIGELLRRWDRRDMVCTDLVWRDMRIYKRVSKRWDSLPPIDGELPLDRSTVWWQDKDIFAHQEEFARINASKLRMLNMSGTGAGKCLGKDTPVVMYDGTVKVVQNIVIGDMLMGPDSNPRVVESLARGMERMYRVTPVKGDPFTCNESHLLSLKDSRDHSSTINMSVKEYLKQHDKFKHCHKLYRAGRISFSNSKVLTVDPYIFGVWLGDGTSVAPAITTPDEEIVTALEKYAKKLGMRITSYDSAGSRCPTYRITNGNTGAGLNSNPILSFLRDNDLLGNKHIPQVYLTSSVEQRLQLLAGILDADGYLSHGTFDIIQKSKILAQDIAFLCRSLGFAAYLKECQKFCTYNGQRKGGTYFRICISGELETIPVILGRRKASPRMQKKSVLVTGFKVEDLGVGNYYGFTLKKSDGLFLLGDFTVTHNTEASLTRAQVLSYNRILVCTIRNSIPEWVTAIQDFLGEEALIYRGSISERAEMRKSAARKAKFIVTTYAEAHELAKRCLKGVDHVIMDEADMLCNPETVRVSKFEPIVEHTWSAPGIGVTIMTATPMGNQTFSIWNLARIIHPYLAGSKRSFQLRYEKLLYEVVKAPTRTKSGGFCYREVKRVKKSTPQNVKELRRKLSAFAYFIDTADITDFRNSTQHIDVEMTDSQTSFYKEFKENAVADLESGRRIVVTDARTKLLRLMQACEGLFNLWDKKELLRVLKLPRKEFLEYDFESGKLDYVRKLLKKKIRAGEKVIVWSRFKPIIYILYRIFRKHAVIYTGDLNDDQKKLYKWAFNGVKNEVDRVKYEELATKYNCKFQPGEALIFLSIIHHVSSRAMNLQSCAYQVFTSFPFGGATMVQTIGRILRVGQKADVVRTRHVLSVPTWEAECLSYVLSMCKTAKLTMQGAESLTKDQIVRLLRILRSSG